MKNGRPQFVSESPIHSYHFSWTASSACGTDLCKLLLIQEDFMNNFCLNRTSGQPDNGCYLCTTNSTMCEWCLDTSSCTGRLSKCKNFVTSPKYCPGASTIQFHPYVVLM